MNILGSMVLAGQIMAGTAAPKRMFSGFWPLIIMSEQQMARCVPRPCGPPESSAGG